MHEKPTRIHGKSMNTNPDSRITPTSETGYQTTRKEPQTVQHTNPNQSKWTERRTRFAQNTDFQQTGNMRINPSHILRLTGVSPHAINVLRKLTNRFKDRSDKFGGDDGEIWEDVYSSYLNCVTQWGVPDHAVLRNIESILGGQAKTYYNRKYQQT